MDVFAANGGSGNVGTGSADISIATISSKYVISFFIYSSQRRLYLHPIMNTIPLLFELQP